MAKLARLRLLVDDIAHSGSANMAIDEVLLQNAVENSAASLRLYRWSEATASLGYFQKFDDFCRETRLVAIPVVRRLSGGGTLVHHHEWTYSLAIPASQTVVSSPAELYDVVHRVVIDVFREKGIPLELRGKSNRLSEDPVLCFHREDPHDVVIVGHKVLGSAQRRRQGAILQHGGLLIRKSTCTPELLGISDLCPGLDEEMFGRLTKNAMLQLAAQISEVSKVTPLSSEEIEKMERLAVESYPDLSLLSV
ncbi:MAG: lipoate--protein ligase [Planctomycetes bacterium]|nr:lipoate--protein ligase [Planctomycetota bacterium]